MTLINCLIVGLIKYQSIQQLFKMQKLLKIVLENLDHSALLLQLMQREKTMDGKSLPMGEEIQPA